MHCKQRRDAIKLLTNFPIYQGCFDEYEGADGLVRDCAELGLDGIEAIWGEDERVDEVPPNDLVVGYHLMFFSAWVDFWRGNEATLLTEFGSIGAAARCYGTDTPDGLVTRYRKDMLRAIGFGADYVVFHVSDVLMHECFTYEFSHGDREVCDCSCELINRILDGIDTDIAFLVENQWWPGLTFCDPAMTRRLLDGIAYDNVGIMLDVGHLMHTNTGLRTQRQAARYIQDRYDAHGALREKVRGMHLHQSLSGEYVERAGRRIPAGFAGSYEERLAASYRHVLEIDRHEPWDDPIVADLVRHINPTWLNNELSGGSRAVRNARIATQLAAARLP